MKQQSFRQFMIYYADCHSNSRNQWLHFIGATLFIGLSIVGIVTAVYWLLPVAIFIGYLLPHVGHKHYQGNQSLRASHPVYCVLGAGVMYVGMWGRILGIVSRRNNRKLANPVSSI